MAKAKIVHFTPGPLSEMRSGQRVRLSELNPKLKGTLRKGVLSFDCPVHGEEGQIQVSFTEDFKIRTNDDGTVVADEYARHVIDGTVHWGAVGEFPETLSVQPGVGVAGHWHGFITDGWVINK